MINKMQRCIVYLSNPDTTFFRGIDNESELLQVDVFADVYMARYGKQ